MATTTTRGRPTIRPEALESAFAFPALEAIFTRRARRFALGAELTGPLAFRSDKEPVPLAYEEEAILVAAATGITGVVREEWPFRTAEDGGRRAPTSSPPSPAEAFRARWPFTAPSSSGRTTTVSSCCRSATSSRSVTSQLQTHEERHELYRRAVKLQDGRLDIPRRRPNLFKFNEWLVNTEGATVFIPVSDVTRQCISAMLLYFDRPHGYYIVDKQLGNDPLRPFVRLRAPRLGASSRPGGLRTLADGRHERRRGGPHGPEPHDRDAGARDRRTSVLRRQGPRHAGRREALARDRRRRPVRIARLHVPPVPDDAPVGAGEEIPVGLEGIFEGACPPFHPDMDAAVDHVLELRWGTDGNLLGARQPADPVALAGDRAGAYRVRPKRRSRRRRRSAATSGTPTAASRRRSTRS